MIVAPSSIAGSDTPSPAGMTAAPQPARDGQEYTPVAPWMPPPPEVKEPPGEVEVECVEGMRCYKPTLDENDCGTQELSSDVARVELPGNLLLVYDRSGSMDDPWNGVPKYQAAGNAISSAIEPLSNLLTVGALFFPSLDPLAPGACACNIVDPIHWIPGPGACCLNLVGPSCVVTSLDSADQIDFRPAADFSTELPNQYRLQGAGMTPLMTGIQQAAMAIQGRQFDGPLTIVVVTDGAPNCGTDENTVLQQVTTWQSEGIKTYVVGLPGIGEAANFLNRVAQAGGSNQFIDPSDPQVLEQSLRDILQETVKVGIDSCTINLNPPAEAPEKLHLVVETQGMQQDVARELSATASWNVTGDGAVVTLEGDLCEAAKAGAYDRLSFEFGCVVLPPAPPPDLQ